MQSSAQMFNALRRQHNRRIKTKSALSLTRFLVQFKVKICCSSHCAKITKFKINTMHHTNVNHEAEDLRYLVQLLEIALFLTLKEKVHPSSHSISYKSVRPTVNLITDSALCCFLINFFLCI